MSKTTKINESIDSWVVRTFNPILKKFGYKTTSLIRYAGLAWFTLFCSIAIILWAIMVIAYIKTGQMSSNASASTWKQIILCGIGLPGYYTYLFLDRIMIDEDIKRKK